MNKTINFSDTGKSLVTREVARRFRFNVEYTICSGKNVIFNMDGISMLSNAFSGELFGELIREFGMSWIKEHTTFKNANDAVSAAIVKAVNDAIKEAA